MAGFLYFVPARSAEEARERLREAGAAHAVEGAPQFNQLTACAPFNVPGYVIGSAANYLVKPDEQEWQQAPVLVPGYEGAGYWLGYERARPPGPQDLARVKQLAGHPVELGDGNRWLVPAARRYMQDAKGLTTYLALPTVRRLGPDGGWTDAEVLPAYRALWDHVVRVQGMFDALREGQPNAFAGLSIQTETDLMVTALAVNYRVGAVEASILGLLTSAVVMPILDALRDGPSADALSKKAGAPGAASTSPGAEG